MELSSFLKKMLFVAIIKEFYLVATGIWFLKKITVDIFSPKCDTRTPNSSPEIIYKESNK